MSNILQQIIAHKAIEVEEAKRRKPLCELQAEAKDLPPTRSLRHSLETHKGGIIAEFKRRSPSKDWIKRDAQPAEIIPAYERAGAAALSILTDNHYFGGSLNDVVEARSTTSLPILRKEFVIDEYQLFEARLAGADACLLIAAAIGAERCHELAAKAHEVGLEVILEVHAAEELSAYSDCVDVIGVNNRNLKVFQTDIAISEALLPLLPKAAFPISESGLLLPSSAKHLHEVGYRGFLIGEAFMRTPKPGDALREYINSMGKCANG